MAITPYDFDSVQQITHWSFPSENFRTQITFVNGVAMINFPPFPPNTPYTGDWTADDVSFLIGPHYGRGHDWDYDQSIVMAFPAVIEIQTPPIQSWINRLGC